MNDDSIMNSDVLVLLDAIEQYSGPREANHVKRGIMGSNKVIDILMVSLAAELAGPLGSELVKKAGIDQ